MTIYDCPPSEIAGVLHDHSGRLGGAVPASIVWRLSSKRERARSCAHLSHPYVITALSSASCMMPIRCGARTRWKVFQRDDPVLLPGTFGPADLSCPYCQDPVQKIVPLAHACSVETSIFIEQTVRSRHNRTFAAHFRDMNFDRKAGYTFGNATGGVSGNSLISRTSTLSPGR